ncbi:MAG TPA: nucleotide disphospho-sugar-binding domain-containing protein [Steroidobacteraceae bacterium]|nr:nucleotide disphospho-sugar-binding domain-containing protein [Steroidobacteraceae bacterium]
MTAKRIVLATFGTHGDVNPFISLGLRLRDLGLDPLIAAWPDYEAKVSAAGLAFHAVRPSLAQVRADLKLDERALFRRAMADPAFVFRDISMPYLRVSYEDILGALPGAALVLTSSLAFSTRLAAEKLGIPQIGVVLQPSLLQSGYDPPLVVNAPRYSAFMRSLGPRVTRPAVRLLNKMTAHWVAPVKKFRRELGLPPDPRNPIFEGQYSRDGVLAMYSPLLGGLQPDHPPGAVITGFTFYDDDPEDDPATRAALAEFLGEGPPPIAFVLGSSAHVAADDFFEVSREVAEASGRRAVLVAGAAAGEGAQRSANVLVCRYAPYSRFFPSAAAVVHQGGIGTLAQALRAGRPQIVVPFHGDQLDNGARAERLGVARVILRRRYRKQHLIGELAKLLGEPGYADASAKVGEQVQREDGAGVAAAVVMRVLRGYTGDHSREGTS